MAVHRKRQEGSGPVQACAVLPSVLAALGMAPGEGQARERLHQLWLNWEMVMGPDLAPLAQPLGRHGEVLRIGVEDAMLAQEMHYMSGEILERVNAFMEGPVFSAVKVELLMGRRGLQLTPPGEASHGTGPDWRQPRAPVATPVCVSGTYLDSMIPYSPVARAYACFALHGPS